MNGREVLDLLQTETVDLIFLDIYMPVLDGYETCRQIRQTHKELPVIALTAAALDADLALAKDSGMSEFLTKPIDRFRLEECLNKYLGTSS